MLKTICICDRCGEEATSPMAINISEYDIETERLAEWQLMPFTKHLCHPCAMHLYDEFDKYLF